MILPNLIVFLKFVLMYYHNEEFSYVMRNFPEMSERPEELKDDLFGVLFDSAEINKFRQDERNEDGHFNLPLWRTALECLVHHNGSLCKSIL